MLDSNSPEVKQFLQAWHENGRKDFELRAGNLNYDSYYPKTAKTRKRFIACDQGTSGMYLIDRQTTDVYSIKAYAVPNRNLGKLSDIIAAFQKATGKSLAIGHAGYLGTDSMIRELASDSGSLSLPYALIGLAAYMIYWMISHGIFQALTALQGVR